MSKQPINLKYNEAPNAAIARAVCKRLGYPYKGYVCDYTANTMTVKADDFQNGIITWTFSLDWLHNKYIKGEL